MDLYGDLDSFKLEQDLKEKDDEIQKIVEKYDCAIKTIESLQNEIKVWKKKCTNIEKSFWSLMETSKAEIKRKDTQLEAFRREKDDILFRRTNPRHADKTDYSMADNRCNDVQIESSQNPFKNENSKDTSMRLKFKKEDYDKSKKQINCNIKSDNFKDYNTSHDKIRKQSKTGHDNYKPNKANVGNTYNPIAKQSDLEHGKERDNFHTEQSHPRKNPFASSIFIPKTKSRLNQTQTSEKTIEIEQPNRPHKIKNSSRPSNDSPIIKSVINLSNNVSETIEAEERNTKNQDIKVSSSLVSELMSDVKKLKHKVHTKSNPTATVPTIENKKISFEDIMFDEMLSGSETLQVLNSNTELCNNPKNINNVTPNKISRPENLPIKQAGHSMPVLDELELVTMSNCEPIDHSLLSLSNYQINLNDSNLEGSLEISETENSNNVFKEDLLVKINLETQETDSDIEQILNSLHNTNNHKESMNHSTNKNCTNLQHQVFDLGMENSFVDNICLFNEIQNGTTNLLPNENFAIEKSAKTINNLNTCSSELYVTYNLVDSEKNRQESDNQQVIHIQKKKRRSQSVRNASKKAEKLIGHKIDGFKQKKSTKTVREASELKNALFKDILEQKKSNLKNNIENSDYVISNDTEIATDLIVSTENYNAQEFNNSEMNLSINPIIDQIVADFEINKTQCTKTNKNKIICEPRDTYNLNINSHDNFKSKQVEISPNHLETIAATTFLTENLLVNPPTKTSPLKMRMKLLFGDSTESRYAIIKNVANDELPVEYKHSENQQNKQNIKSSAFEKIEAVGACSDLEKVLNNLDKQFFDKIIPDKSQKIKTFNNIQIDEYILEEIPEKINKTTDFHAFNIRDSHTTDDFERHHECNRKISDKILNDHNRFELPNENNNVRTIEDDNTAKNVDTTYINSGIFRVDDFKDDEVIFNEIVRNIEMSELSKDISNENNENNGAVPIQNSLVLPKSGMKDIEKSPIDLLNSYHLEDGEIMVQEILEDLRKDEFLHDKAVQNNNEYYNTPNSSQSTKNIDTSCKLTEHKFFESKKEKVQMCRNEMVKKPSNATDQDKTLSRMSYNEKSPYKYDSKLKISAKLIKNAHKLQNQKALKSKVIEEVEEGEIFDDEDSNIDQMERTTYQSVSSPTKSNKMKLIKNTENSEKSSRYLSDNNSIHKQLPEIPKETIITSNKNVIPFTCGVNTTNVKVKKRKYEDLIETRTNHDSLKTTEIKNVGNEVPNQNNNECDLDPTIYFTGKRFKSSTKNNGPIKQTFESLNYKEENLETNPQMKKSVKVEQKVKKQPEEPKRRKENEKIRSTQEISNFLKGPKANFKNFIIPKLSQKLQSTDNVPPVNMLQKNIKVKVIEDSSKVVKTKCKINVRLSASKSNVIEEGSSVLNTQVTNDIEDKNKFPIEKIKSKEAILNKQDEQLFDNIFKSPLQQCPNTSLQTSFERENANTIDNTKFTQLEEDFRKIFGISPQQSLTSPSYTNKMTYQTEELTEPIPTSIESQTPAIQDSMDISNISVIENSLSDKNLESENRTTSSLSLNDDSKSVCKSFSTSSRNYEFNYNAEGLPTWTITRKRKKKVIN